MEQQGETGTKSCVKSWDNFHKDTVKVQQNTGKVVWFLEVAEENENQKDMGLLSIHLFTGTHLSGYL